MRSILQLAVPLFSIVSLVSAQGERFCESDVCFTRFSQSGVSVGFVFPPGGDGDRPNEFLGIIQAPGNLGYVGLSLGGPMVNSLLLVGWVDGNTARLTSRIASDYVPPTAYSGPQITVFNNLTRKDGGGQRIVFRCQGCSSWNGGQIAVPEWEVGWAGSDRGPSNAGDANSGVPKHSQTGFGTLKVERSSSYQQYLQRLQGGPPASTSGGGSSSGGPTASRTTGTSGATSGTGTATGTQSSGTSTGTSSATVTGTSSTGTSTSTDTTTPTETGSSAVSSAALSSSLIGLLAGAGLYALL